MKIKFSNRQGEEIIRTIHPGQKLVGLRIHEFIIETYEEALTLNTEAGRDWYNKHILHIFRVTPKEIKDSNWGSDWVDDGV